MFNCISFYIYYLNLEIDSNQVTEGGLHDSNPEVLHLILSHVFNVDEQLFGMLKKYVFYIFVCNL